jgi:hypothetical protein
MITKLNREAGKEHKASKNYLALCTFLAIKDSSLIIYPGSL